MARLADVAGVTFSSAGRLRELVRRAGFVPGQVRGEERSRDLLRAMVGVHRERVAGVRGSTPNAAELPELLKSGAVFFGPFAGFE